MLLANETIEDTAALLHWRRSDFPYTLCYCEENVWHLCKAEREGLAVFCSNKERAIRVRYQRIASPQNDHEIVWDYHVFYVRRCADDCQRLLAFDHDSLLEFGCVLKQYVDLTFGRSPEVRFRVVPAQLMMANFSSDRSHMKKPDGSWLADPPNYPPIIAPLPTKKKCDEESSPESSSEQCAKNTLQEFINMDDDDDYCQSTNASYTDGQLYGLLRIGEVVTSRDDLLLSCYKLLCTPIRPASVGCGL